MSIERTREGEEIKNHVPRTQTSLEIIRWTRQPDGSYQREGDLPDHVPTVRIFVSDADEQTEGSKGCPGLKLWVPEEAVALVERMIADGAYQAWRYEVRPDATDSSDVSCSPQGYRPQEIDRLCSNPCCKKGPDGARAELDSHRAKYCSDTCRVDVCRRNRRNADTGQTSKPARKVRSDKKYPSQAARQRAYDDRKRGSERLRRTLLREMARFWTIKKC